MENTYKQWRVLSNIHKPSLWTQVENANNFPLIPFFFLILSPSVLFRVHVAYKMLPTTRQMTVSYKTICFHIRATVTQRCRLCLWVACGQYATPANKEHFAQNNVHSHESLCLAHFVWAEERWIKVKELFRECRARFFSVAFALVLALALTLAGWLTFDWRLLASSRTQDIAPLYQPYQMKTRAHFLQLFFCSSSSFHLLHSFSLNSFRSFFLLWAHFTTRFCWQLRHTFCSGMRCEYKYCLRRDNSTAVSWVCVCVCKTMALNISLSLILYTMCDLLASRRARLRNIWYDIEEILLC